jgi:hypothetical protein
MQVMLGIPRSRSVIATSPACVIAAVMAAVPWLVGCQESVAVLPGDVRQYTIPRPARVVRTAPDGASAASGAGPSSGRESAGGLRLRYDVPDGWTDRGAGGLRLATLVIGEPAGADEVTVIPAAGTLASNVARWQGQLEPDQEPAVAESVAREAIDAADTIDVNGVPATVVLLLDEAARTAPEADGQAILAAMIPLDDTASLFVKFKGAAAVARRERERFGEFVTSIRWK